MNINNNKTEKLVTACQLPKDVCLGASLISITGNREIEIENFKNIIKLNTESIILQCKHYQIIMKGSHMEVKQYSKDGIIINGNLKEITFL